jgi:hypothetical protein
VLMKLVEQNPSLVSQLLNAKAEGGDKPAPADEEPEEEDEEDTELEKKDK